MMQPGIQYLSKYIETLFSEAPQLASLIIFSSVFVGVAMGLRYGILRLFMRHRRENHAEILRWRTTSFYVTLFVCALALAPAWLASLSGLLAVLGLFGAGVLLVMKEVILNVAGWFYIMVRRPFVIGNRVRVGDNTGDVLDIRLLAFTMIEVLSPDHGGQSTGRVIHIPNALLFTQPLSNASKEFSFNWNEVRVPLEPGSDWERAVELLQEIASQSIEQVNEKDGRIRASESEYAIHYNALSPSVFVEFRDGAILLSLRHLTEPRKTRLIVDRIWREFLKRIQGEPRIRLHAGRAI